MKRNILNSLVIGTIVFVYSQLAAANTVQGVINDMTLPGEGMPHGVPSGWDWAQRGVIQNRTCPAGWSSLTAWGQVYRDTSDSRDTNTRIQFRGLKAYVLSKSTHRWRLYQNTVGVEGAAFAENFANNANVQASIRKMPDGTIAVKIPHGYNFHFWPTTARPTVNCGDIAGVFFTGQSRLILDSAGRPDDRGSARYIMNIGGDWWKTWNASWSNFTTNKGIAIGRFKYVKNGWRSFNMSNMSAAALRANPPPMN